MTAQIIPFQLPLPPTLPTIEGNVDYRLFRDQLLLIDQQLKTSSLEARFIQSDLERWLKKNPNAKPKHQQNHQLHAGRALRCTIARTLLNEDYRGFAARLADSLLLQHFCGLSTLASVTVPAKTTLQRYFVWWPEEELRRLVHQLIQTGIQQPEKLRLQQPLDLELCFLDTTCVAANIHYPVDWVLLRDATRTLMKALSLIREQGLKHRMGPPQQFLSRMNRLCMEMNHARSKPEKRHNCKSVLRKIDRLVGTVRAHARRHRNLLDQHWKRTQWTRPQAEQVLGRIDHVLKLLPQARKQARQRILSGEVLESKDKLLSLYEPEARVIVRHKAGAEVEFGNTLLIGETQQGVILDWNLFEQSAPADARLVDGSLKRIDQAFGQVIKALGTDRGFDSQSNRSILEKRHIYNALCPRDPQQLKKRNRSWKFKRLQKRRGQIEPRIAILKNNFLGQPLRSKGFQRRNLSLSWAVLTHNLWVIARLALAQAAPVQRQAA
jgi:hypothetical protein